MIFGDVLFIKLKNPLPHEIDFSQYAWPWREALLRKVKIVKKIELKDIYNTETYGKEEILDMDLEEDPVESHPVLTMHKPPGAPPILKEIDVSLEAIREIVGRDFSWVNLGEDVMMFAREYPHRLEPNFLFHLNQR